MHVRVFHTPEKGRFLRSGQGEQKFSAPFLSTVYFMKILDNIEMNC